MMDPIVEMGGVQLVYQHLIPDQDPLLSPLLIVGQLKNLVKIKFEDVKHMFMERVPKEDYNEGVRRLVICQSDPVHLYLNVMLAALPDAASRHNAPARPHALTKLLKAESIDASGKIILVVCERADVFAHACAAARAFPLYSRKTQHRPDPTTPVVVVEFAIVGDEGAGVATLSREEAQALQDAGDAIRLAARIVDAPCSEINVDGFLAEIKQVGQQTNAQMTVVRGLELAHRGMGGIYGVGRAASCQPALAVLSHTPPGAEHTVAWVGKGIVYDSGGLSIKSKTNMPGMKRDCGGAAGVLGAFYAMVKQGFTQNLHAVFCLAENSVGPDATRPDDIHTLYSKRTVEINNTDAEGRLVLADGVVYAQRDLKADLILDMATLTGAQPICTGKLHAAVLTNSADWERNVVSAGQLSGDLVFPIVYCPELHFNEFTSAVADMKNSVGDRENAQSSCAGLFVLAHLGFDFPGVWIHVDMATPVHVGERATGYGVALLISLFGSFSSHKYFQYVGRNIELNFGKQSLPNAS